MAHQHFQLAILWQRRQRSLLPCPGLRAARLSARLLRVLRLLRSHHPQQVQYCQLMFVPLRLGGTAGQCPL